ncbi:g2919 [Coccomyxa viridis]|uniref:G2919 protein n=1 Tax=Coccomyxa viridis TaxID=1274662 RepID=A0ABP1FRY8_9CHLO
MEFPNVKEMFANTESPGGKDSVRAMHSEDGKVLYYTTAKSAKRSTAEFKEELAKQAAAMQEMVVPPNSHTKKTSDLDHLVEAKRFAKVTV